MSEDSANAERACVTIGVHRDAICIRACVYAKEKQDVKMICSLYERQ